MVNPRLIDVRSFWSGVLWDCMLARGMLISDVARDSSIGRGTVSYGSSDKRRRRIL